MSPWTTVVRPWTFTDAAAITSGTIADARLPVGARAVTITAAALADDQADAANLAAAIDASEASAEAAFTAAIDASEASTEAAFTAAIEAQAAADNTKYLTQVDAATDYAPAVGSAVYGPFAAAFPPPPMPCNSLAAVVLVADVNTTLPHAASGTETVFSAAAEPGRYDWFSCGGKVKTDTYWMGAAMIAPGSGNGFAFRCVTNSLFLMLNTHLAAPGVFDGRIQVRVNGVPLWSKDKDHAGTYAGTTDGIDITFPDNAYRTVEVFCSGTFWSVRSETGKSILPMPSADDKSLYMLGDSWIGGTVQTTPMRSFPLHMQALTPWNVAVDGLGGTGYVAGGADSWNCKFGDTRRTTPIIDAAPDVLVVFGSINDQAQPAGTVQAAATALYAAIATDSPATKIIVIGAELPGAGSAVISAELAAAAAAAANVIGFIDPVAAGWIVPGITGPADFVHPSLLGSEWLARRVEAAVRELTVLDGDNSW